MKAPAPEMSTAAAAKQNPNWTICVPSRDRAASGTAAYRPLRLVSPLVPTAFAGLSLPAFP